MGSIISRIVLLVVMSVAYWLCAFTALGMLLFGDCDLGPACRDAKQHIFETSMIVAVGLYLALLALTAWTLFKHRES